MSILYRQIHRGAIMDTFDLNRISRRGFLRAAVGGLAGISTPSLLPGWGIAASNKSTEIQPPPITIESNSVIKVLRWNEFVKRERDIWLANTRRWEKLTGGRVETDFIDWTEVGHKAKLEATVGSGHDIVLGWFDDPHLYPDKLVDLTDLADYLGKKYGGWYPVCRKYGHAHGSSRWICIPIGISGQCINYRKSKVQEVGFETLPGDINGFLECCKALKAKGHYTGFALGHAIGDASVWTHWWLWSFGGKIVESDGKTIAINSKETVTALDTARELYETMIPGTEKWLDPDNNKAFLNGGISLTNNGSSIAYAAKNQYPQIDADLVVTNYPMGFTGRPTELAAISVGFIFKHSPFPNAAKHYLRFMFEAEQYGKWISGSWGYITQALKHYYDLPAWKDDPRITPYRECASRMLPNGYAGPLGPKSAAAMSEFIIVDMFADVCTGRHTPKQAAKAVENRLARFYR